MKKILLGLLIADAIPVAYYLYKNEYKSPSINKNIDTKQDIPEQFNNVIQKKKSETVNNNSDSITEWIDSSRKSQWTKPNSLLLVKAQGDYHSVTPINQGSREILKLIYTQSKNPNKNFYKELERFN